MARADQGRSRRRLVRVLGAAAAVLVVLGLVRLTAIYAVGDDSLVVRIGSQAPAFVDLRESTPISPYVAGANVFPAEGTSSVDRENNGFMSYGPPIVQGLRDAHVKLLRFPGGRWGEQHVLSYAQLSAYGKLLTDTGAEGMVQVRLSGSIDGSATGLDSVAARANLAGRWVDFMNNARSVLRTGEYAQAALHPVERWTVGNEPDDLVNPDTGKPFTVAEYVDDFVQFSKEMHQNGPSIQVFGPEISQFYGVGGGPRDSTGQLWMEGFLKGVGDYERAHPDLGFHLLDGVSFHRYPVSDPNVALTGLMSSAEEWNYSLAPLRQLVQNTLGRSVPLAVTEINSNAVPPSPPRGLAALWWADTLATLMNMGVEYVAFFSTEGVDTPYPLFTAAGTGTVMLRVLQLFSHLPHHLIPLSAQRDPISVYAARDDSHQAVSLLFVNKASWPQLAQVRSQDRPFGIGYWSDLDVNLAAFGVTLVTLHHGASAEAYSFDVEAGQPAGAAPPPIAHTLCGHATDPLVHDVPC